MRKCLSCNNKTSNKYFCSNICRAKFQQLETELFKDFRVKVGKGTILEKAKKNPRHILCMLTGRNFKLARDFWGDGNLPMGIGKDGKTIFYNTSKWKHHLQQLVLSGDRIKYLEKFL